MSDTGEDVKNKKRETVSIQNNGTCDINWSYDGGGATLIPKGGSADVRASAYAALVAGPNPSKALLHHFESGALICSGEDFERVPSEGEDVELDETEGDNLAEIMSPKIADLLLTGGFETFEHIVESTIEELTAFEGVGEVSAQKMIDAAQVAIDGRE